MIGVKQLARMGKTAIEQVYDEATQLYIADKVPQARNLIIAMSIQQRKDYFFYVLALYPDNREFLQFVMYLI